MMNSYYELAEHMQCFVTLCYNSRSLKMTYYNDL